MNLICVTKVIGPYYCLHPAVQLVVLFCFEVFGCLTYVSMYYHF